MHLTRKGFHERACARRLTANFAFVGALLAGCAPARSPAEECRGNPILVALGFERAKVGHNELPIAILCNARTLGSAERATSVQATFSPADATTPPVSVDGVVRYQPGARVLDSSRDRMSFDYLIDVVLDRPGRWLLQLWIRAPWTSTEAKTTLSFPVDDAHASAPSAP